MQVDLASATTARRVPAESTADRAPDPARSSDPPGGPMAVADFVLNGRFLLRQPTGVDRFAIELMRARQATGQPAPRVLVPPGEPANRSAGAAWAPPLQAVGRRQGHAWEQFELPRAAGGRPIVNLCNTAPALREAQMVVLHDAASAANPGNYTFAFRSWYRVLLTALMRRSRVVATVSKFSADELVRHFGPRPAGRAALEVIPEGGEHILREPADTDILRRLGLVGRRFVLAVGSRSPNKNFEGVLKALQRLPQPDLLLVATGGQANAIFGRTSALADPRVVSAGYVSDAELRALYEHAACFVFPSFYEGFGLPPLEAMCCGCPVVVSRRASLPEVCGDAALYGDPDDPDTLAAAMARLLESRALREELAAAGRARAAQWTWARAAERFDELARAHLR